MMKNWIIACLENKKEYTDVWLDDDEKIVKKAHSIGWGKYKNDGNVGSKGQSIVLKEGSPK